MNGARGLPSPTMADQPARPSADASADANASSLERARPRKRTRLACDKCSASRTRCDGHTPCRRCQDYGYACHYNRHIKRRGRLPRNAANAMDDQSTADADDQTEQLGSPSPAPDISNSAEYNQQRPEQRTTPHIQRNNEPLHHHQAGSPAQGFSLGDGFPIVQRASGAIPSSAGLPDAVSNTSDGYPSPGNLMEWQQSQRHASRPRASFSTIIRPLGFGPLSPDASNGSEAQRQVPRNSTCRFRCLDPLLPYLGDTLPVNIACDLFEIFLIDPGTSLFKCASPYVLTRIFRKKSLLNQTRPRPMSAALLATILWACAQTADISPLLVPGSRSKITNALYELATLLIAERDPDKWRRIHGGLRVENEQVHNQLLFGSTLPSTTESNEPVGAIDDVLTFILLCIGVSGGDFKSDCIKWWSKAVRLALSLRLNREDEERLESQTYWADQSATSLAEVEMQEERRRVFWMLYSLDRHLALSFNRTLQVPDSCCAVFAPLPEHVWENLDEFPPMQRMPGPPTTITGSSFFEYFLPLMVILGDIIELHHSQHHPRLGSIDNTPGVAIIADMISRCEESMKHFARLNFTNDNPSGAPMLISNLVTTDQHDDARRVSTSSRNGVQEDKSSHRLVIAYSTFILHVLHVLLHGKWDAISMLDNDDEWITTPRFAECASHAIAASEAVSEILQLDPELTFMPYLFGIYLLHGSFILLLFADRMPQLGPNQSVEQACETIIRAHEVCVVTLSTEFQRNFRRVVRSTLYSVRGSSPAGWEEHKRARRRVLSLYRWTKGAKGLGI